MLAELRNTCYLPSGCFSCDASALILSALRPEGFELCAPEGALLSPRVAPPLRVSSESNAAEEPLHPKTQKGIRMLIATTPVTQNRENVFDLITYIAPINMRAAELRSAAVM